MSQNFNLLLIIGVMLLGFAMIVPLFIPSLEGIPRIVLLQWILGIGGVVFLFLGLFVPKGFRGIKK